MEIRQLEYFLELCSTRSFTKAADKLCVAQPSVTKAIQQLEQELGVSLFDRNQKPIAMTKECRFFRERVAIILKELNETVKEVQDMSYGAVPPRRRIVNLGVPPRAGIRLIEMLNAYDWQPDREILCNIVERSNPEVLSMLLAEKLSLGWIMNINRPFGLRFTPVEVQEVYCLLEPNSPLAMKSCLTFEELKNESFAMDLDPNVSSLGSLISERCRQAGFRPKVSLTMSEFPGPGITRNLIRSKCGVMFSPVYDAMRLEGVAIRPMSPPLTFEVGLAWKDKRELNTTERGLKTYICEEYPKFLQSGSHSFAK